MYFNFWVLRHLYDQNSLILRQQFVGTLNDAPNGQPSIREDPLRPLLCITYPAQTNLYNFNWLTKTIDLIAAIRILND